jgi:hypothetical protein
MNRMASELPYKAPISSTSSSIDIGRHWEPAGTPDPCRAAIQARIASRSEVCPASRPSIDLCGFKEDPSCLHPPMHPARPDVNEARPLDSRFAVGVLGVGAGSKRPKLLGVALLRRAAPAAGPFHAPTCGFTHRVPGRIPAGTCLTHRMRCEAVVNREERHRDIFPAADRLRC